MTDHHNKLEQRKQELLTLTEGFCRKYLNEEYVEAAANLIELMDQEVKVPYRVGRIDIWAGAVVHAVCRANFLFYQDVQSDLSPSQIFDFFGVHKVTTTQKSKRLLDMFEIIPHDYRVSVSENYLYFTTGDHAFPESPDETEREEDIDQIPIKLEKHDEQMAKVMGNNSLKAGNAYSMNEVGEVLEKNKDTLMKFYYHLKEHLIFPFIGDFKFTDNPYIEGEEVTCNSLDDKLKIHPVYGILVKCIKENQHLVLPLTEIEPLEYEKNDELLLLYRQWFWSYE